MLEQTHIELDAKNRPEKWLLGEARKVQGILLQTVGWSLTASILIILQARLLAQACQMVVFNQTGVVSILSLVCVIMFLVVMRGILVYFSERNLTTCASRVKEHVRSKLYRRLQALGPAGLAGEETGRLIESVTTGVEGLEPYIIKFLPHLVLAVVLPIMALIIVFFAEWRTGLVLLLSAPFIPFFMILIGRGSERLNQNQWSQLSRMSGHLLDLVQGLPDLKMFGAAKREAAVVARVSDEYRQATMAVLRLAFLSALTLEFFATVGTALVAVIIGFRLLGRSLSLADGLFVLLLAPEFYLPLRTLGLSYHSRMQGVAAAEQIASLFDLPLSEGYSGELLPPEGAPTICFEGVTFRYGGKRGGVGSINLELPAGSLTALTGESGTGKTTLLRLLVGLVRPESGRILVNGTDLALLSLDLWRKRLAWVPQNPFYFAGTIRENLLLGRTDASEEDLFAALEVASALEFIQRLPLGLNTALGDRGAGLSGGELRRLAVARAFLQDAFLVVLDEPTAGLDIKNEQLVVEALQRLAVGRTVLIISHHKETLRCAERVAVMVGGGINPVVPVGDFMATWGGIM